MYFILAAHGRFASAVKESAEMVYGQMEAMTAVEFLPGENAEDLKKKYQTILEKEQDGEILFLVDLFGGSPYNAAFETALREERMEVLTGLTLPMLIEAAGIRALEPELKGREYIHKLGTDSYIRSLRRMTEEKREEKEDEL